MLVGPESHSYQQPVMLPQLGRADICSEHRQNNSKHPPTVTRTQIRGCLTDIKCTDSKPNRNHIWVNIHVRAQKKKVQKYRLLHIHRQVFV